MSDLKTGHLVGSIPRQQQIGQLIMCWIGPLVAIGVLYLLWGSADNPGFGPNSAACIAESADCLGAPQGEALKATLDALRSSDSAVDKYAAGAVMGGALSIFPIGGIAVLVGLAMYLPFPITLAYGVGCVTSMALERRNGRAWVGKVLVPASAGLIVGEALTSLGLALYNLMVAGGAA